MCCDVIITLSMKKKSRTCKKLSLKKSLINFLLPPEYIKLQLKIYIHLSKINHLPTS